MSKTSEFEIDDKEDLAILKNLLNENLNCVIVGYGRMELDTIEFLKS